MKVSAFGRVLMGPVMLAGLIASANAFGATIDISTLLTNPSFEGGVGPLDPVTHVGCPAGWTCGGSPTPGFTSYTVTAAQYTAGSDGLASGIVPNGVKAGTSPTNVEGSGSALQTGLGTYAAGTTYTLTLWVGTPMTLPIDNSTPVGKVSTITIYFLGNGAVSLPDGAISVTSPAVGKWVSVPITFTPTDGDIGQTVGFEIFENSGGNNQIVNFDIGSPTPEPASLLLGGLGIAGLGLLGRRRRAAK